MIFRWRPQYSAYRCPLVWPLISDRDGSPQVVLQINLPFYVIRYFEKLISEGGSVPPSTTKNGGKCLPLTQRLFVASLKRADAVVNHGAGTCQTQQIGVADDDHN